MKKGASRFLSVFTLLSRLPVKASFEPDYSRADFWIPAIAPAVSLSAAVGAGASFFLVRDPLLAALGGLACQYLAFNLFHVDGLLDTADAMATWATKERRLEILKDSRIGSYAFFFGWLFLTAKLALLGYIFRAGAAAAIAAILAAPLAGRAASALVPLVSRPARPEGLGALMRGFSAWRYALGILVGAAPLLAFGLALGGIGSVLHIGLASRSLSFGLSLAVVSFCAVLAGAAAGGLSLAGIYKSKVGGFTGDALGAAVEAGELACLAILAALAHFGAL
jgi:adenosylcobinamide-GDP ribazoletransferase